jgi:imidazolonepropionase
VQERPLLLHNAAELVTVAGFFDPAAGDQMEELGIIQGGSVVCQGGEITFVGKSADVDGTVPDDYTVIDATGKVITPGLVDAHTHLVFAGSREDEFEQRVRGKTYLEIAEAGGGILRSVRQFREASSSDLLEGALSRLDRHLSWGVTTVESKSGYGLETSQEIRGLETIARASKAHCLDVVPTFLGAHEFPSEFRTDHDAYVQLLLDEMIPAVVESGLAEFCDVFCEEGVFTVDQSRVVLQKAAELGLGLKIHADEFSDLGGAKLAAELGARSADHLVRTSVESIEALAGSGCVAVLLPGTTFFLGHETYAPAREFIRRGVPVALATDNNPGSCMTECLPLMMTLGCIQMGMSPAEVLTAVTINGAHAVNRSHTIGSIEAGKQADLVVFDMPSYRYLPYHVAGGHVDTVVKRGAVVLDRSDRTDSQSGLT